MSPRTRATFAKRQKEQARQEKQRAKAQRKLERKLGNQTAEPAEFEPQATAEPADFDPDSPVAEEPSADSSTR